MNVDIGNRVKFLNEDLVGEIKVILSNKKLVVSCSDGFDHEVLLSDVIVVGENNELNYSVNDSDILCFSTWLLRNVNSYELCSEM